MKKGFTLIELLAVIIILAVIALIATPVVLNVVEEAKVKSDRNSVYGLIDAAKLYYAESLLDSDKKAYTNGTTNVLDYLVISGEGPESGKIFINDKGQSAIAVVYGKVCFTKNFTDNDLSESDDIENCDIGIEETTPEVSYKCIRATQLHTEECAQTNYTYYCGEAGYTASGSKGTTTITYGNLETEGTLTSGDAFDCDVNGDGTYDSSTERFYYVSDLSNNSEYAVLIYYNNTTLGVSDNTYTSLIAYDSNNTNYSGPVTAITNLPTTTQWNNVSLSNTSRAITTETGTTSTTGGTLPTEFSYSGYAARLLTAQEVNSACNIIVGSYTTGELDGCNYLMENTKYSNSSIGTYGYWLETPYVSSSNNVWSAHAYNRSVRSANYAYDSSGFGVRPVIEVLKTDIDY